MHYHHQNLNESGTRNDGASIFWHGRAWLDMLQRRIQFRWEWMFGRLAQGLAARIQFGNDYDCSGSIMFHVCLPFILSFYFSIDGWPKCRETRLGFSVHHDALWFYLFDVERNSVKRWYRRTYYWNLPWQLDWFSTEILDAQDRRPVNQPNSCPAVWTELACIGKSNDWEGRRKAAKSVSALVEYGYRLKSGQTQLVFAQFYVERRVWYARWYPLIHIKKVSTCIDVEFLDEFGKTKGIGEGAGTYKGGVTACGYEMLANETPIQTLRRMESERRFER